MLHLTPAMLEQAYEFLRVTQPFKRWGLPHADEVAFQIHKGAGNYGGFACYNGRRRHPCISISATHVKTAQGLIETMAHEMVHLQEFRLFAAKWNPKHGKAFQRMADQVCRHHEFDRAKF